MLRFVWAKSDPFHLLVHHCIDVGQVAALLLCTDRFANVKQRLARAADPSAGFPTNWAAYLAACHDVGKCDPDFQDKVPQLAEPLREAGLPFRDEPAPGFRHEARSWSWLKEHLLAMGWAAPEIKTIAAAVRGHHGDFNSRCSLDEFTVSWGPLRDALAAQLRRVFAPPTWVPKKFLDHSAVGVLLSGLIVMADWIASNAELFPVSDADQSAADYSQFSAARAAGAIRQLGLAKTLRFPRPALFRQIWTDPGFDPPRPLQKAVELACEQQVLPGLVIIEAPMGEGKTEAAVYLATQWMEPQAGFYVALPTAATSNQMHDRMMAFVRQFRSGAPVRLVHGMAWLIDDRTPGPPAQIDGGRQSDEAAAWFRPSKRALLAPLGVGTVDQALMSVLHVRFGFLRLFGLAGGVLIIDEVHAYDAYMSRILSLLLSWCAVLNIPVILLSATLPARRKHQLVEAYGGRTAIPLPASSPPAPYPLLTFCSQGQAAREASGITASVSKQMRLITHPGLLADANGTAGLAVKLTAAGGCTCVVVNTVRFAQDLFRELERLQPADTTILLFHSRFTARRRNAIERQVLDLFDKRSLLPPGDPGRTTRPERAILVGTQVVEQSLDLDFDRMLSQIAPIDLLLQRAGRLHRHDRPMRPGGNEPVLHLLMPQSDERPDFASSQKVYSRFILLKSLAALHGREQLLVPQQVRELIEQVYDDDPAVSQTCGLCIEDSRQAYHELCEQRADDRAAAGQYLIPEPDAGSFDLARLPQGAYDEAEGAASNYFQARTRLGDDSRRVLVISDPSHLDQLQQPKYPNRAALRDLFLQMATVPQWWLLDAQPREGCQPITTAPDWAHGIDVLPVLQGVWKGTDKLGKPFIIRDDPTLGLVREGPGETE